MPNLDGGHYFLTTLIPVKREPVKRDDDSFTVPSHLLRETLATMPTAQQTPVSVAAGFVSPFSRCTRTHFARAVVIDQPMYNGRDADDALLEALRKVNLLAPQPVDNLSRPYLMFNADIDARPSEPDGGLASWARGLWADAEPELRAIFQHCVAFENVGDGAAFAAWLKRCQLPTTMSFNDYYVTPPDLQGYTASRVTAAVVAGTAVLAVVAAVCLLVAGASLWWLVGALPLAFLASAAIALAVLSRKGSQPFPSGADTDLPSVLKALYVQQRFALLAGELQGVAAKELYDRFGDFARTVRPDDVAAPTQRPGVIRSDDVPLVDHKRFAQRRFAE